MAVQLRSVSISPIRVPSEQDTFATAYLGRAIAAGVTAESFQQRIMADAATRSSVDDGSLRQSLAIYQRKSGH